MNRAKTAILGALLLLGAAAQTNAQTLVQTFSISLIAYDQSADGAIRPIRITTRDLISSFAGTNVNRGQLLLITPAGNIPGAIGDLNAFLRVNSGNNFVIDVPSPDSFNLFQDFASVRNAGNTSITYAANRFSFDFGYFHSELQGFSTWSSVHRTVNGVDLSGSGSFYSSVSGEATLDGVTHGSVPARGTIVVGPPKPGP